MPEDSSNTKTPRHKEYEQSFGDQRPGRERNRAAIANRTTSDKAAASVCCFGLIDLCLLRVFVPLCRGWLVFSSLHSPRLRSREASPPSLGRSRAVSPISRMNCIARFLRLKPRFQSALRRRNGSFVPQSVSPQPFVFNDIGSFVPSKNYPPPQSHVCSKSTTRERPGRTSSMAVCTPVALHLASRLFSIT